MLSFKAFITEQSVISEASASNDHGELHEIETGRHLNGGKHMSPEAEKKHDDIKARMHPDLYNRIAAGAKSAAEHIRNTVCKDRPIKRVHWTSRPGDIERATGVKTTQIDDPADIVLDHGDNKMTGVSLKGSARASGSVPLSNRGLNDATSKGLDKLVSDHKKRIDREHPNLPKNDNERKAWAEHPDNKKEAGELKSKNTEFMNAAADHMHKELSKLSSGDLAHHIRTHALASNPTSLQRAGHNSVVHTTYVPENGKISHAHNDPSSTHEDKLKDHKNITIERNGQTITFKHRNVPFARQWVKQMTGRDPKSSFKVHGNKIDKPVKT